MEKKRVLITGVSGLLGSNLARCWQGRFEMLGIYHNHPVILPGVTLKQADLLQLELLEQIFKDFAPHIVIHCAALASIDLCEEHPALARRLNVKATRNVRIAASCGAKIIYISTDAVYAGDKGDYTEQDPVGPLNCYARTKLDGELEALIDPQTMVVRTSFYGTNILPKKCLAEWMISELSQGRGIKGFTDVISSNIYIADLAELLAEAIAHDLKGVYNLACRDAISKYDFALAIARLFGFDGVLVSPISIDQFPLKAKRSKDLSLNTRKLSQALGLSLVTMDQSMARFAGDHHQSIGRERHERIPSKN